MEILNSPIEECIEKIIEDEKINGIIVGPTVYSIKCFSSIYEYTYQKKIPIIVPNFPLNYSNISQLKFSTSGQRFLVFGGGKLIDFVKICACRDNVSLIVLLSSISNDGFASSFSSLRPNACSYNRSYQSKSPKSVYACVPLLNNHMPDKFWVSGVGELLSKLNVREDLRLDKRIKRFDDSPFQQIETFMSRHTQRNEISLIEVIKQLYSFSILMKHDSGWCSRSEHEFEKLYADSHLSHGQLVLMGALIAMKIREKYKLPHLYEQLKFYCEKLNISLELKQEFDHMLEYKNHDRMYELSLVRPERFGLWNVIDSTRINWKCIIEEIRWSL